MRTFVLLGVLAMVGCGASGQAAAPGARAGSAGALSPAESVGAKGVAAAASGERSLATSAESPAGTRGDVGERAARDGEPASRHNAMWVGAAAESELLMSGTGETFLGVWVDAPEASSDKARAPVDLALVIDISGSMAGEKIVNARGAARQLVESLNDGDIVSIDTFSDAAHSLIVPTVLTQEARTRIVAAIERIAPHGSTNLFDGLSLGEAHASQAPPSHTVRRVVVISDGIANVGPSSPEALGAVAERGLTFRTQVTSLGVGNDYDENTLNALAMKSSGRLYHIGEPREMAAILKREVALLESTVASAAFVEVVPAPGVTLLGAEGARGDWAENGALRIPLGALFGGQHREALVRVRINGARETGSRFEGAAPKPLASVRLHFRDPNDGDIERIQEVVARVGFTSDAHDAVAHVNARTKSIVAITESAKLQMQAAQSVNQGQFVDADKGLEAAEAKLDAQARATTNGTEKRRLQAASQSLGAARAATRAAAAAPKAVQRDEALQLNKSGMSSMGF